MGHVAVGLALYERRVLQEQGCVEVSHTHTLKSYFTFIVRQLVFMADESGAGMCGQRQTEPDT